MDLLLRGRQSSIASKACQSEQRQSAQAAPRINFIGVVLLLAFLSGNLFAASVGSSGNPALTGQPVIFTATIAAPAGVTAVPSGTVTFTDNGQSIGTSAVQAGVAELTTQFAAAGQHSIVAQYSGDANFAPESSSPFTETITSADIFTIAASPSSITQKPGDTSDALLTLYSNNSAAPPVKLACEDLPPGVSCSFSSTDLVPTSIGTQAHVTVASTASVDNESASNMPPAIVFAVFLPLALRGRRRLLAGCSVAVLAFAVGCGGGTTTVKGGTPAGSYAIHIAGTDGVTTQSAIIQLTVTQ